MTDFIEANREATEECIQKNVSKKMTKKRAKRALRYKVTDNIPPGKTDTRISYFRVAPIAEHDQMIQRPPP